jgi:hypothetical protein
MLPLAPLPTIGEQTILERTVEKQLVIKAYRLLTVYLLLYLFHGLSRLPSEGDTQGNFCEALTSLSSLSNRVSPLTLDTICTSPIAGLEGVQSVSTKSSKRRTSKIFRGVLSQSARRVIV